MIAIEDWAEIRRLHRSEGVPIKEIARRGKVTAPAAAFAGTLATRIRLAPPRDPEFKGTGGARHRTPGDVVLAGQGVAAFCQGQVVARLPL